MIYQASDVLVKKDKTSCRRSGIRRSCSFFCKKITSAISVVRKLKEFVDRDTLVSIFNAIVQPYFTYCCEVCDIFGETQSQRLQKLQNRCARIIMDMGNEVNAQIALNSLGWETLKVQRTKAKAK